jgi:thiol-disulfide isomerase/thioredoxin
MFERGSSMKKASLVAILVLFLAASVFIQWKAHQTRPFYALGGPAYKLMGERAPTFSLPDLSGVKTSLDQYRGKMVLIDFWATWCGPCRMSMPLLAKVADENPNDLVLLAVNLEEPPETVRGFIANQKVKGTILLDHEGSAGRLYHADSIPLQVLIDQEGVVRLVQVGFNPVFDDMLRNQIKKLRKTK